MKLRTFQDKDTEGVKTLVSSILHTEFSKESTAYAYNDLQSISKAYGGPREAFFVIEDKGKVVATVGIKEDTKPVALMRRLFVDPEYRTRGLGALLVRKAIQFCNQKGYHKMVFRSTDRMYGANALCLKKGFKEEERYEFGNIQIIKYVLSI